MKTEKTDDLIDIIALALPFIEDCAVSDPAYKPGAAAKLARRMRSAVQSYDKPEARS